MADIFGVSVTSYGNWERGDKEPDIATISSICREYSISADWLLGLTDGASCASLAAGIAERATYAPPPMAADDQAYWRNLVESQQRTIAKLSDMLQNATSGNAAKEMAERLVGEQVERIAAAVMAEGRNVPAAPVHNGGRGVTKTA